MNDRPWLSAYPAGVPADVATDAYASLADLLTTSFKAHGDKIAFSFMGQELSYSDLDQQSRQMAAYLQSLGLAKGDRVAIMLPNVLQYPISVAAILRAGYVVVNVNPLYTRSEEHTSELQSH